MGIICNPVNVNYRYQFIKDPHTGKISVCREAADPSMICYKGRYYIFASMTLGVWVSDDLVNWENKRLPDSLPLYDYAPDARVIDEKVVLCASRNDRICDYYSTTDIINGPYERIEGSFPFWDPNLFQDDDGRLYFYWGCSAETPIYGVEVDRDTLRPKGDKKELIFGDTDQKGFERTGDDNSIAPRTEQEIDTMVAGFAAAQGIEVSAIPEDKLPMIRGMFSQKPYVEGPWMDKFDGKYYLQYATPGTEFNTYGDAVYVSDSPLGPFKLAENNPYSLKPGGFIQGAGHGSTIKDMDGRMWHVSSMRISVNHPFERRVGIWRAGIDEDGELFCNQRYGDWPMRTESKNPWDDPEWFLLSYGKEITASSYESGHEPFNAVDENVRSWWKASGNGNDEWICLDLGKVYDVRAIQVNFADDVIDRTALSGHIIGEEMRYIDDSMMTTSWLLEGSVDGKEFFCIEDKQDALTDLNHDLVVREDGLKVRYIRLANMTVPYHQNPCVAGLRVFGIGDGRLPEQAGFEVSRVSDLDIEVRMHAEGAVGYNVLWGSAKDKLYHSEMCFGEKCRIGATVKGKGYFVKVDTFNENGITKGNRIEYV